MLVLVFSKNGWGLLGLMGLAGIMTCPFGITAGGGGGPGVIGDGGREVGEAVDGVPGTKDAPAKVGRLDMG